MPSINDLKAELEDIQTLKFISSAFTEASSAKIKKLRAAFEENVEFHRQTDQPDSTAAAVSRKLGMLESARTSWGRKLGRDGKLRRQQQEDRR